MHPPSGGVMNGVRDRRRHSHKRDFTEPLHPQRIDDRVFLIDEVGFDMRVSRFTGTR